MLLLILSPSDYRPHVSISETLLSALASWGILLRWAYGWYLLNHLRAPSELLRSGCSFYVPLGSGFPPGLAGVNQSRLTLRFVPILYHFGQAY